MIDFSTVEESQRVEAIRFLIQHPAWTEFFAPALETAIKLDVSALRVDSPYQKHSPDYLRGRLDAIEWFLNLGEAEIAAHDLAQRQKEEAQTDYAERAQDGRIGPR